MYTPFTFKRMVLLAGKTGRAFAALAKLTPARADMLLVLHKAECSQRALAEWLGVTESVVSRMVKALERLGLVARRVPARDKRLRLVHITEAGRNALDKFFDGWMPDDGRWTVQVVAEGHLLALWGPAFAANGFRFDLGQNDAGPILRRARRVLAERDYWADDFGEAEAKTMRCHRNFKDRLAPTGSG